MEEEGEGERDSGCKTTHTKPFAIEMMRYIRGLRFIRDASWKRRFKIHISKFLFLVEGEGEDGNLSDRAAYGSPSFPRYYVDNVDRATSVVC